MSATKFTNDPICPHCGTRETDAWEIPFDGMDGDAEHCCGHCGEDYLVSRNVSVSYSTSKLEAKP